MKKSFEEFYKGWHLKVSLFKSAVRLLGCGLALLFLDDTTVALFSLAISFGVAEILGIVEEIA